jgi:peptidoglycan L-alanyl-D-glutamate endopeptidase CwlK
MNKLNKRSETNLAGVHPKFASVVSRAAEICDIEFTVIEGVRTKERQAQLYAQGRTTAGQIVTWTLNSNHFINAKTGYGHAVDILPATGWNDLKGFDKVAAAMFQAASELRVKIRWGKDWNMNGKVGEKGESDSPHFEMEV